MSQIAGLGDPNDSTVIDWNGPGAIDWANVVAGLAGAGAAPNPQPTGTGIAGLPDGVSWSPFSDNRQYAGGATTIAGYQSDDFVEPVVGGNSTSTSAPNVITLSPGGDIGIGGSGSDWIIGSTGGDFLIGGGGDNILFGGPGYDRAVFSSPKADYDIVQQGGGYMIVGPDGVDYIMGVEELVFSDEGYALPASEATKDGSTDTPWDAWTPMYANGVYIAGPDSLVGGFGLPPVSPPVVTPPTDQDVAGIVPII